jgi:hypothetical protein
MVKWMIWFLVGFIVWIHLGCGPNKPTIETGIIQSAQAANASMLAQADWSQIFARIRGKVGPDTEIVVTAKQIIGGEVDIRFRGAELEYEISGSGTGGGWETNKEIWPDIMAIQQRWEKADDATRADKAKWASEIADVIAKRINEDAAAKTPAKESLTPLEPGSTDQ